MVNSTETIPSTIDLFRRYQNRGNNVFKERTAGKIQYILIMGTII
jgi:hypothetical protein